jgi:hypothetical protein
MRVKDYRNLKLSKSKDLGYIGMKERIVPKKVSFLIPPLPLVEEATHKDNKKRKATNVINFILKQRAGSTPTGATYKVKVTRFAKKLLQNGLTSVKQSLNSGDRTA